MLRDGIELFQLQGKGDLEHAPAVKIAVRHKNVIMGIKAGEVAESLYGDDGAGGGILFGNDLLLGVFSSHWLCGLEPVHSRRWHMV